MKFKKIIYILVLIFSFIDSILLIVSTNTMWKQSAEIQLLKQSSAEQIEEKEFYINRCQELENIIIESEIVVDECDCE